MQINGDDFLKKVQLKQEGEELKRKLNELNQAESNMQNLNLSNNLNSAYNSNINSSYEEIQRLQNNIEIDNSADEFDSLILEKRSNRSSNKKKYLILSAVLLILFFLTIVIFGLLNSDRKTNSSMIQDSDLVEEFQEQTKDNSIEDDYQKILDEQNRKIVSEKLDSPKIDSLENLDNIKEQIEKTPAKIEPIISNEDIDKTIKKIEEKKVVKATTPAKTEAKKSIKDLVEGKNSSQTPSTTPTKKQETTTLTKGFYVQIGAFSKQPDSIYLQKIKQNGFEYKVLNENINGKNLNKVLVGPFKSRAEASAKLPLVKEKLNINGNPFIVNH